MTDKELEQLINEIDSGPLLTAPIGLKEEILAKADKIDKRKEFSTRLKKRGELILYSLEVTAVTAAAVFLIIVSPLKNEFSTNRAEREATLFVKEESIRKTFFDKAHKIVYLGDFMDNLEKDDPKEERK